MIRILICDDDKLFAENLSSLVIDFFRQDNRNTEINICATADKFRGIVQKKSPDLIFLDLVLKNGRGFDLAEEVRTAHMNTEIVFITNYPEQMPAAFAYRPIGFLTKPATGMSVGETLRRYLLYYNDQKGSYCVNTREFTVQIPYSDIMYFESAAHQILIYRFSDSEPVHHTRRLEDIASETLNLPFIRIHKSYLVHIAAISHIDKKAMLVHLKNSTHLPISRAFYSQAIEQYMHYRLR